MLKHGLIIQVFMDCVIYYQMDLLEYYLMTIRHL